MEEEASEEDDGGTTNPIDELELDLSGTTPSSCPDLCSAHEPRLVYARFPPDVQQRQVFLTFPVLCAPPPILCSFHTSSCRSQ